MITSFKSNLVRYAAVLCLAGRLCAQFSSSIEGTVTDSSSAAIPSATITLTNNGTGIKTTVQTNSAGYFLFPSLPAGLFSLSASGSGFKTVEITDLRLETGTRRTSNMMLEVGTQATVVNVKAEVAAVDLSDAKVAGVIESKQLIDLPIPGRNFMSLVNLTPGVLGTNASAQIFGAETGVEANAAGLRSEQNGFAVDGGTVTSMVRHGRINLQPNTESIEEVQITVNNFSASAGNDAGASVRVLTRSGTNDYHGSASWFHQNNVLTSRNIFQSTVNSANGRALPVTRRNEFAGSLGGPIKKNKTFLFASFDILRQGTAAGGTSTVETPELASWVERNLPNRKSAFLIKNYPAAFTPYLAIRPASQVLGAANCGVQGSTTITAIPCATPFMGDGITPVVSVRNGKQWSLRGDHMITEKDRFYANVFRTGESFTSGNTTRPIMTYVREDLNWFGNVNHTRTFSSTLLNEIRANVVRVHGEIRCVECQIPVINITGGLNGFGVGGPTPFLQNNYELHDTLTWIKGGHNIKAGFTIGRLQANWKPTAGYQRPTFTFQSVLEFMNDDPFSEGNIGLNPVNGSVYTPDAAERQHTHAAFFDDTWKVTPRLTVTMGLRWESYGKVNQATLGNNVEFRSGNDMTSRIADGKNATSYTILQNGDWNNFAPRLSFAWDPKGNSKTSVRGGVGVFYDFMPSQLYGGGHYTPPIFMLITASRQTAPFLPRYEFGASKSDPFQFPRPFGIESVIGGLDERNGSRRTPAKADITWTDPSLRNSYTYQYFLGIQRALTSTMTLEVNYVGNQGRKLYTKYNVNRFPGDLIRNNNVITRLNDSFGSITYGQSNLTSAYNGGNVSIRKRYSNGFLFQGAYTFGNALGISDSFSGFQPTDWWNLKLEKGPTGYNVAQKLALSAVWEIPAVNMGTVSQLVTKGWQLSGVAILQAGGRFSVTCGQAFAPVRTNGIITGNSGCDFNADGTSGDRPNAPAFGSTINMDKQALIGPTGTFRAADFPKPALGQVGNLGRNTYTNPGYASTDLALMRNFKAPFFVSEGLNIQFRAEAFNALNRANLGGIQGDMNNTNFGRVTGINGNNRRFQFGLRISF